MYLRLIIRVIQNLFEWCIFFSAGFFLLQPDRDYLNNLLKFAHIFYRRGSINGYQNYETGEFQTEEEKIKQFISK